MAVTVTVTIRTQTGVSFGYTAVTSNAAAVSGVVVDAFDRVDDPDLALLDWDKIDITIVPGIPGLIQPPTDREAF